MLCSLIHLGGLHTTCTGFSMLSRTDDKVKFTFLLLLIPAHWLMSKE